MRVLRTATAGVVLTLAACTGPQVTLQTRPTDLQTARALARLVADTASCGWLEDLGQHADHWDFTCQTGSGEQPAFEIRAVASDSARRAAIGELAGGSSSPLKAGDFFLVQQGTQPGRTNTAAELDRFPGRLVEAGQS